jgi:hypothetical protein
MKAEPILDSISRVKDKLSRARAADLEAYSEKLEEIAKTEEQAGRIVSSMGCTTSAFSLSPSSEAHGERDG